MIWNKIKVLRAERDWTQADLAEKVGISRQAVISIESTNTRHRWNLHLRSQKLLMFPLTRSLNTERRKENE